MNRNNFTDVNKNLPKRIWVGVGEIWSPKHTAKFDAIYILQRNDEGSIERYAIYYLEDINKKIETESEKARGHRFMGVSANGMYDPSWQRIDTSELDEYVKLKNKFTYRITGSQTNLTKDEIINDFGNPSLFDKGRIKFS